MTDSDHLFWLNPALLAESDCWRKVQFALLMKMLDNHLLPNEMGRLVEGAVVMHAD
jgi:hypothetical protein